MKPNERRDSKVPLGTFGSSDRPPAPEQESAAGSEASPRKRYARTLVGHPTAAEMNAGHSPVPAPPKWQGAEAYRGEEQPELQMSSIPTPSVAGEDQPSVPVARIETRSIAVSTGRESSPGEQRASDAGELDDHEVEELLFGGEPTPVSTHSTPPPSPSPRAAAGSTKEYTAHEAPAATDEQDDDIEDVDLDELLGEQPAAASSAANGAAPSGPVLDDTDLDELLDALHEPEPEIGSDAVATAAPPAPIDIDIGVAEATDSQPAEVPPSLAPAELAAASKPGRQDRGSPGMGVLFAAAMLAILAGGWLLTRGSYQRSQPVAEVPAQPSAAAAEREGSHAAEKAQGEDSASEPAPETTRTRADSDERPEAVSRERRVGKSADRRDRSRGRTASRAAAERRSRSSRPAIDRGPPSSAVIRPRSEQATGDLTDTPTRAQVLAALEPISDEVERCASGQHGVAEVDITVVSSGAVTHAVVGGDFAGTAEGSCIARAVRGASFAPFRKPRFRVIYPFSL